MAADNKSAGRGSSIEQVAAYGKEVDFGQTATDYGRFRLGYPDEIYRRLRASFGVGRTGQQVLDLATGTGFLGRGFARAGARVIGLDIATPLLREAIRLDADAAVTSSYVVGRAEALPFPSGIFDVVSAGQSWHWFERARVAAEARRVLRRDGQLLIAHFDWIPLPGNVVEATEQLIRQHNPRWRLGGGTGVYPLWPGDAAAAGFSQIETFTFDIAASYTHASWRGRIRASAGVGGTLAPAAVAAFDRELATLLRERFPADPMAVPHRTFALVARPG